MLRALMRVSWAAVVVLSVVACADEHRDAPDAGWPVTVRVGRDGGAVELPNGAKVTVPAGAFEDDTSLELDSPGTLPPLPNGYTAAGDALHVDAHGAVPAAPVVIELPYSGNGTIVYRLDDENDTTWTAVMGATFAGGVARFETTAFGIFIVARRTSATVYFDSSVADAGDAAASDAALMMDAAIPIDAALTMDAVVPIDAAPMMDATGALDATLGDAGTDAAATTDASDPLDAATPEDAALADAATPRVVLYVDFEGPTPSNVDVGGGVLTGTQGFGSLGTPGNTFETTFLRGPTGNVVTVTFSSLPPHDSISIDFLLAAIDSLDGTGSFPAGDFFRVDLDGVTIFRESLANALPSQVQSYVPYAGVELARHQDLGFGGPGGYYTDSAYDMGVDPFFDNIAHTASSAVLSFTLEGAGVQDLSDESWAIDNLRVTTGFASATPRDCTPVTSDFTATTDGWSHTGASTFEQQASGGNPGGLLYVDNSDSAITYVFAGAQFLGDRSEHHGGNLRFDGNLLAAGGSAWTSASQDYGWVRITSGSEVAEIDLVSGDMGPPANTWTTFSVPLSPQSWGKTPAQWRAMLQNVTEVRICLEALYGAEVQAIDNVALDCPAP